MKIFISHSHKDKWLASCIAAILKELGCETFLDEKDQMPGDAIDHSIRKGLSESDHFLVLLSPASIQSDWVLIELGGALALKKKVIPVLIYVQIKKLPQIISLKNAIDINDLPKYFDYVKKVNHIHQ
jgi:hypothetical protein